MSKEHELWHSYFGLLRAIASQENLLKCLVGIGKQYKPLQKDSVEALLSQLNSNATIFLQSLS